MIWTDSQSEKAPISRSHRLKEAVLASFRDNAPSVRAQFAEFNSSDWERILFWLDISGLALYLLDRLTQLNVFSCLPAPIRLRLTENLRENRDRTAALFREACAVSREMALQGISFALLKGVTLTPESVPDCNLRVQADIDFLVAARNAEAAKRVLRSFGYRLRAVGGTTLEFKAGILGTPDIRNLYRVQSQRSLDLRLLPGNEDGSVASCDRLRRARARCFHGFMIPALSPADIFVQQGLHLFKDLCSEHTRASSVLEFWRHIQARHGDKKFWSEVELLAKSEPQAKIALGASVLLTDLTFGDVAPPELTSWTTDRLPPAVRLWIETYGRRVLLAGSPGNKLYLILRQQLPEYKDTGAAVRRLIFPFHLPLPIARGEPGERLMQRMARYRVELLHTLARACFHVVEGLRYAIESSRWARRLTGEIR